MLFVLLAILVGVSSQRGDHHSQVMYFVVEHVHYELIAGAMLAVMASIYHGLPEWSRDV
jgi:heme/copper-type cytochrome/quinol oxidase subunit 1